MTIPLQLQKNEFGFVRLLPKEKYPKGLDAVNWTKNPRNWKEAERWLEEGRNYGVMGGYGGLIIIDPDAQIIVDLIEAGLPQTFTVQTGSGRRHYYYFCPELKAKIVFNDELRPPRFIGEETHYGEVMSFGEQVVGPGSIHPDTGKKYEVLKDLEIATVSPEQIFETFNDFLSPNFFAKKDFKPIDNEEWQSIDKLHVFDILKKFGISTEYKGTQLQTSHPIHGSEGGLNFAVHPEKNAWHCFRHQTGGGWANLIAVLEGIIDCSEAVRGGLRGSKFMEVKKIAEEKYGLPSIIIKKENSEYPDPKSAKELLETQFPETLWLINRIFTLNTINQISAAPNQWKSWLTQYFAYKIAKGEKVFNKFFTTQMGVLIVNEEDPVRTSKNRLSMIANEKIEDLPIYFYNELGFKLNKEMINFLIKKMNERNLKVVIFDSLSIIHEANENSASEMNEVFRMMKEFIKTGITVIFTNHHRKKPIIKGQIDNGQEQTRGSTVINAVPAGHITCEPFGVGNDKFLTITQLKLKEEEKIKPFIIKILISEDKKSIDFVIDENGEVAKKNNLLEEIEKEILKILEKSSIPLSKIDLFDAKPLGAGQSAIWEAISSLKRKDSIDARTRKEMGMPMGPGRAGNEKLYFLKEKTTNFVKEIIVETLEF